MVALALAWVLGLGLRPLPPLIGAAPPSGNDQRDNIGWVGAGASDRECPAAPASIIGIAQPLLAYENLQSCASRKRKVAFHPRAVATGGDDVSPFFWETAR